MCPCKFFANLVCCCRIYFVPTSHLHLSSHLHLNCFILASIILRVKLHASQALPRPSSLLHSKTPARISYSIASAATATRETASFALSERRTHTRFSSTGNIFGFRSAIYFICASPFEIHFSAPSAATSLQLTFVVSFCFASAYAITAECCSLLRFSSTPLLLPFTVLMCKNGHFPRSCLLQSPCFQNCLQFPSSSTTAPFCDPATPLWLNLHFASP